MYFWLNERWRTPVTPENYEGIRLYWTPLDIRETRERFKQHGYVLSEIVDRDYGQIEFFVTDDDGYSRCFGVAREKNVSITAMKIILQSRIKKMSPVLFVADIERAITFYTTALGFDLDFRYEDFYAGITSESFSIHLKLNDSRAKEERERNNKDDIDILFSVEDIKNLFKELNAKSINIVVPLRAMPYGTEFYISDPDGHILAFVEER